MDAGRDPLGDRDAVRVELDGLVGVVAQQPDPVSADCAQHLGRGAVVALVLAVPEREVGLVGVETSVLQRVGIELGVETDTAPLLTQVEQEAAGLGDPLDRLPQLRPAVAALGPEDVAGEALTVWADQRRLATGGRAFQRSPPVTEAEE